MFQMTSYNAPWTIFLLITLCSIESLADSSKLCPRGNVTVHSANNQFLIVSPDRCYPTPVVDRNVLSSKPKVELMTAYPGLPYSYTALMVQFNSTYNKYNVYWMEPNLTVNAYHVLSPNASTYRDIRKMIEYRPPKFSSYNLTYQILVYRQSSTPVLPPLAGPFNPYSWASSFNLNLIGGAEFMVRGSNQSSHLPPAHHYPLPPPGVPIPPAAPGRFPPNAVAQYPTNTHYGRNFTNNTHFYPNTPNQPPYNPSYPQPPPYNPHYPQQPPPYNPHYPQPQVPNQFYPPNNVHHKRGKGAGVALEVTSFLIIFAACTTFVLNL